MLATDQGFLQSPKIVWETLSNIDGDIYYCNSNFCLTQSTDPGAMKSSPEIAKSSKNNENITLTETDEYDNF